MKMWISRDKDKRLLLWRNKPIKNGSFFNEYDECGLRFFAIDYRQYPEVTFENSPQEVELVIKKKEQD